MKAKLLNRKLSFVIFAWLLISRGALFLQAQTTNGATDISRYPDDQSLLPGKGPVQTWTDFPKIWAQREATWKMAAAADKGAVVFLGDSITQFWKSLSNDFSGLHVANRGISGDTTRGVLYRLPEVNDLSPEAIVLLIGTNDLGLGGDPAQVAANIHDILLGLHKAHPKMPIIVCRVMPRNDRNLHLEEKIKQLNSLIDGLVKNDPSLIECDTWTMYADANGDPKKAEFKDLLHPTALGYAKWTAALKPILAKLNLSAQTSQ